MVGVGNVVFYKSTGTGGLGGAITAVQITHNTANNLFPNTTQAEQASGKDYYLCAYVKNNHSTEDMDAFNFWLGTDSVQTDTTYRWGFDSSQPASGGYHYSPSFVSDHTNTDETASTAALQLSTFTCCAWFRTSSAPTPDEGFLVNKGGTGSESAGENLNYGLWMTNTGTIRGGFETSAGTDNLVTSPLTYHNGN